MTMFLGLVLEILTLVSHANLQKPSDAVNSLNKFLITDGLLRKAGLQENQNADRTNSSSILQPPSPKPTLPDVVKAELATKWTTVKAEITKMELMQRDGTNFEEPTEEGNTTEQSSDILVLNKEHLVGQHKLCDPIYEHHCSGSQCVQVFEGSIKCIVDRCRRHFLLPCRNGRGCFSQDQHCDEVTDCDDASDEMNCLTLVQVHDERHFYTRTVPFMAILCLMGVAASFVLYHQTNAARQRQRHLSMVGLTNALTTAGLAQHMDGHTASRAWRTRDGPGPGLLGDTPESDPRDGGGLSSQQLEHMATGLHDLEHLDTSAQQLQLLAGSPDGYCDDPLDVGTYASSFHDGYRRYSADYMQAECSAPPSYETALEMGMMTDHNLQSAGVMIDSDPPPYESVSHITCTSVFPMTNV